MSGLYIREGVQTLGPFTEDELRLRCAEGSLPDTTMSWLAGEKRWISLGQRWRKHDYRRAYFTAGWLLSATFAALGLIVSTDLVELPRPLQGFPARLTIVVTTAILSLAIAWWHWMRTTKHRNRPTLGSVLCALLAVSAAVCSFSTLGVQKRIGDIRASLTNASMALDDTSGELRINGYIADRFADDLRAILERSPNIRRITIDSPGGFIDEALKAGELVAHRGFPVRVLSECASACTVFWSSASKREMRFGARLGLHQSRFEVEMPQIWKDSARGELGAKTSAILKQAGFRSTLLEKQANTPASDMYWLDAVELLESGVQLTIVDTHGSALDGSHAKFLSFASSLPAQLPFRKLMEAYGTHAPQYADKFGPNLYAAWRAQDRSGLLRIAGETSAAAKAYAMANSADAALVAWARGMQALAERIIATSDAASCKVFLDGTQENETARPVSNQMVLLLVDLMKSTPNGQVIDPSSAARGQTAVTEAIIGSVFQQKVRQGFPVTYQQWSPLQKCQLMNGIYVATLRRPLREAARTLRAMENF